MLDVDQTFFPVSLVKVTCSISTVLPFLQAAIGSLALDTARSHQDEQLEKYGMDVLTVAFLAILITAPVGALAIGLAGPRLLQKAQTNNKKDEDGAEAGEEAEACEPS